MIGAKMPRAKHGGQVTLKAVAQRLGLSPGTVSAVLNNTKAARTIPENTRKRIIETAHQMNYRPNFLARSLRVRRTYTVGVIVEEVGDFYGSMIVGGIEPFLRESNFFFLTVAHRHDPKLLRSYSQLLTSRGVEGVITIDTSIDEEPELPTVAVAGHQRVKNVTNIILDHYRAAELGLLYLRDLGHEHIAFLRGLPQSSDSVPRWEAIENMARRHNIPVNPDLVLQIEATDSTPELGYPYGKMLLERKIPFTALFGYNDISAMGAMRAFQEAGLRIPGDISVIGFDDIPIASYSLPTLTTIRQPLEKMGRIAAQTLLDRIEERTEFVPEIAVEPELVIRQSAGPARKL
jgi:DNA-binding LacI/PurR family transcriptional regulator